MTAFAPSPRVGMIGLGLMGRPMALNLRRAGVPLVVHNRSIAAVDTLRAAGAAVAADAAALGREVADGIVLLALTDAAATNLVLRSDRGLFTGLAPGALIVHLGTASVDETAELLRRNGGALDHSAVWTLYERTAHTHSIP